MAFNKTLRTLVCPVCGKTFDTTASRKVYCSAACVKLARLQREQPPKPEPEEVKEIFGDPLQGLDEKLAALHAAGTTYSQAQQADTIRQFARVEVPDAFRIETPEQPVMIVKEQSMTNEMKLELIKAQAKLEVLVEYFRGDGIEFPGKVIGEVVAQLSELICDGEEQ